MTAKQWHKGSVILHCFEHNIYISTYIITNHSNTHHSYNANRVGSVMIRVIILSAVDRWFEPLSGKTKPNYKIGLCYFSDKHTAFMRKSKDWSPGNQDNVSEWSDMFIRGLLFQCASTIKIPISVFVLYKGTLLSYHWKLICSPMILLKNFSVGAKHISLSLTILTSDKTKYKTAILPERFLFSQRCTINLPLCLVPN